MLIKFFNRQPFHSVIPERICRELNTLRRLVTDPVDGLQTLVDDLLRLNVIFVSHTLPDDMTQANALLRHRLLHYIRCLLL